MAIGTIWKPPIDQQTYDAVNEKIPDEVAEQSGLRFHAAGESPGGWRVIEIWESREKLDAFIANTLRPAIAEVSGGQAPEFEPEVFEVHVQFP
jgi:quinol monooxygenase YgiN